jgi:hypothetical protein
MWAVFEGDEQLTAWNTARDRVLGAWKRSGRRGQGGSFTLRKKGFIEPSPGS